MLVVALHDYYREQHLAHVIAEMRKRGAPRLRGYQDPVTGTWYALEGTHRLRAAMALGLVPIMIPTRWPRSSQALIRARHAAIRRAHVFLIRPGSEPA